MDDKEFYAECVKRLPSTIRTKTNLEMIFIVLRNTSRNVPDMFDDKAIYELFEKNNNGLLGEAYKFIRDNQDLYVNPQYMNSTQVDAIIEDKNAIQILKSKSFCDEDNKLLLNQAIYRVKPEIIEYFMEKGIMPSIDTAYFIDSLAKKPEYLNVLQYIESKGVDLLKVGSGSLILTATFNHNAKGLEHLLKKAPMDMYVIRQTFAQYIGKECDWFSKNMAGKRFVEVTPRIMPIIHLLMPKISNTYFDSILDKLKREDIKEFLKSQYLVSDLDRNLMENPSKSNRIKI
jgi:hypothetical protein